MIRTAICLLLLSACGSNSTYRHEMETGFLQNGTITEASGVARSIAHDNRLWVINDGGSPATLYAVGHDGSDLGEISLPELTNIDWEDLASFRFKESPKLLIADVGDNLSVRKTVTLYIVDEPDRAQDSVSLSWQISLRYPDGPRDVEAVAVDADENLVYLLSKRTLPAELYCVPLHTADTESPGVVTAIYLGAINSLPQPTEYGKSRALAEKDWYWQPTAMDFSADGERAVILTYRAAYLYERDDGDSWLDALQGTPLVFPLNGIKEAEAVTLLTDSFLVTVEAEHAPLYQFPFKL